MSQRITPFLWFDGKAKEATDFYVSIFPNSKILDVKEMNGAVFMTTFQLEGLKFFALNGGPMFQFSQAISFYVDCPDQAEVDRLWDLLAEGGEPQQCGWVKDKFGVTWQIIPSILGEAIGHPDPEKAQRAMHAMLQMTKLEIQPLLDAVA